MGTDHLHGIRGSVVIPDWVALRAASFVIGSERSTQDAARTLDALGISGQVSRLVDGEDRTEGWLARLVTNLKPVVKESNADSD